MMTKQHLAWVMSVALSDFAERCSKSGTGSPATKGPADKALRLIAAGNTTK